MVRQPEFSQFSDAVLGQLGNRVQHALRAFTVKDQKTFGRATQNNCPNP
nr:helicase HerA-like domain-containing protein [Paracoccus saliphilus]